MRPRGTGAPPIGVESQEPPEKYLLDPFVDRVRVVFAFSAAGPAFKAGHQAWGVQGGFSAGVRGYRDAGALAQTDTGLRACRGNGGLPKEVHNLWRFFAALLSFKLAMAGHPNQAW